MPISFDDLIPSGVPRIRVTPNNYADAISSIESGGRYDLLGPVTRNGDRAYGRYQVMGANVGPWTKQALGRELTAEQFLADREAQDAVFQNVFGGYVNKYGPEGAAKAWFAGEKGMQNPNARDILGTSVSDYAAKFNKAVGAGQPRQSVKALSFDDLIPKAAPAQNTVAERSGEFAPVGNEADLRSGLQRQAAEMTRGPQAPVGVSVLNDFLNQGAAAGQRTTPIIGAHQKNLISTEVFQNDAGEAMYRDPSTGQVVPTDQNKHVILRDPADNRLKVFARTEDTNEGALASAGRLLGTGLATGAPTARPAIGAKAAVTPRQTLVEAANRIGVDVPRAVATDSMAAQRTAAATRNIPLAGDPIVKATERTISQLGNKASEVAGGYGGGTAVGSGDAAKAAINRYITGTTKQRATKLYDAVDNLVDNSVLTDLSKTRSVVAGILAKRGEAALPPGESSKLVTDALERPGLSYRGIKTLRSNIGESVDSGILPPGMSASELKQIYGALSDDLARAVDAAGGSKATAAFKRANEYYKLASGRRETLAKIVGVDGSAPAEQVFDRLLAKAGSSSRADISALAQARKAIGADDWNEFVSGVVAQMGRDPFTRGAPEALQGADFSPQKFLTAYNKLSNSGRDLLFRSGGKGNLADSLRDIAQVSGRFKELQKFSNPSGTAQTISGGGIGAGIVTPLLMGNVLTPLAVVGGVVGGRAMAHVLSKPATVASTASWSRKYEQLVRKPSIPNLAAFQLASRNLATNLRDVGVSVSPGDFLKAISGPVPARSDQEQQ